MKSINESYFYELTSPFLGDGSDTRAIQFSLHAESSLFLRFNGARVRQIGEVDDALLGIQFFERDGVQSPIRRTSTQIALTGDLASDRERIREAVDQLKKEVAGLLPQPYAVWPVNPGSSSQVTPARLPESSRWPELLFPVTQGLDFTGILAAGRMVRASRNSLKLTHWFETENATLDYSLVSKSGRAVKSEFAFTEWNAAAFAARIGRECELLRVLDLPAKKLQPGDIRCWLGPAAMQDVLTMVSWGAISEDGIRQGTSPFKWMRASQDIPASDLKSLSPKFSLIEDCEGAGVPRFNERGEVAPAKLSLIEHGKLVNTWVSARTAKEYAIESNGANGGESLRAPMIKPGSLADADVFQKLGTGAYLPNLHYLNWSDQASGRITGMTRHACVWVEDGRPVAPIENMRWDDTLFRIFGSELEELGSELTTIPETGTYAFRGIGATRVPGILLRSFRFTL